ncbi:MAG: aminotransferase class I/II-fold pyridoxal phosphate-dependent enzyme [Bacteroidales bacterium]|nr:aminotransferase class I/II-fold pyridoxal phosphate-dependent enzyme [Bacteroidales bacterium]
MIKSAKRTKQVREYYFSGKLSEIRDMISDDIDVINMGIGNPDIQPPGEVIKTLTDTSARAGVHGYQPYNGIYELRAAISEWYKRYYNIELDPESQVLPLIGSKEGILHISMAYLDRGDNVLVPDPGYPAYASAAEICGAGCIHYDLEEANNWMPSLEKIQKKDLRGVKLMWINYPNMPTGARASDDLFRNLVDFAREHNILLINDNPYSFILNTMPLSILTADKSFENVLELNSLSKSHNMAGWRMGMVLGHKHHINNILRIKSNMDSGMFLPLQLAAVEALRMGQDWYAGINAIYALRKQIVLEVLDCLDCWTEGNQSGMFLWSKIPDIFSDSYEFSDYCLHRFHLFITPGQIFGLNGHRFIRTSLCINEYRLREALIRVKKQNHEG